MRAFKSSSLVLRTYFLDGKLSSVQELKCFSSSEGVQRVQVEAEFAQNILTLRWNLPEFKAASTKSEFGDFKEGLWADTCSEFFLGTLGGSYFEWNFAPNGNWACFEFESERKRTRVVSNKTEAGLSDFKFLSQDGAYDLSVCIHLNQISKPLSGLLIYNQPQILKQGERVFYYAFNHRADKPDFHDQKLWEKL